MQHIIWLFVKIPLLFLALLVGLALWALLIYLVKVFYSAFREAYKKEFKKSQPPEEPKP